MLNCSGVIGIPRDVDVKHFQTEKGVSLYFDTVSQDVSTNTWHRYRAKLWVPKDSAKDWLERIKPQAVFFVQRAWWSSMRKNDEIYPKPLLVLEYQHFHQMEKPLWLKNKQQTSSPSSTSSET